MFFKILKDTPYGRRGTIYTSHGLIETPEFIFCATHGSIKSVPMPHLTAPVILCNAFHLRHQVPYIQAAGGLHQFISWNRPIITDSGGYQVMSMGYGSVSNEIKGIRTRHRYIDRIDEDGCYFRDARTGAREYFNAERSMDIQAAIGVDMAVAFDECTVSSKESDPLKQYSYIKDSMHRSHRWGLRSLERFRINKKPYQRLYGLVHGGTYEDLRKQSVEFNAANDFDGAAIGGTLGKTTQEMHRIVKYTAGLLRPLSRPVHLLGIGRLHDIDHAVKSGVDTLDCVDPTRVARHGVAMVGSGRIDLGASAYEYDRDPIDLECGCITCQGAVKRNYIHYLISIGEMSAMPLIVQHNMYAMNKWMQKIRDRIDAY